jgi:Holliday junction resolvasome RuvABC endonuclease subunit
MERQRTIRTPNLFRVLANDPSLTAWGWAIVNRDGTVEKAGCIKTSSENKVRRIRKGDDTIRRVSEINYILLDLIRKHNVNMILSELPHGSQNASAAVMIGIVTGIVQTIADVLDLPVEWYSEGDAKKHLLHKRSATKNETITAISKIYEVPWRKVKYIDEAVADAMAVYHVARNQSAIIKSNL